MMKTVNYSSLNKNALRKKGWKLFGFVVLMQCLFMFLTYSIQP